MESRKFALIAFAVLAISFLFGCAQAPPSPPKSPAPPSQFEIYYSYGVGEGNLLDTEHNRYVIDACPPPSRNPSPAEFTLALNESDKEAIRKAIIENGLMDIKEDMTNNCIVPGIICQPMTPLSGATLRITMDGKTKTIRWHADYIEKDDPDQKKFQNATNVIRDILSQNEKAMGINVSRCKYQ